MRRPQDIYEIRHSLNRIVYHLTKSIPRKYQILIRRRYFCYTPGIGNLMSEFRKSMIYFKADISSMSDQEVLDGMGQVSLELARFGLNKQETLDLAKSLRNLTN